MDATTTITTGYEIVSVDISVDAGNCTVTAVDDIGDFAAAISSITVSAPSGKKVVGGGYTLNNSGYNTSAPFFMTNGPSADGTSWQLAGGGQMLGNTDDSSYVWATAYAICMAV